MKLVVNATMNINEYFCRNIDTIGHYSSCCPTMADNIDKTTRIAIYYCSSDYIAFNFKY